MMVRVAFEERDDLGLLKLMGLPWARLLFRRETAIAEVETSDSASSNRYACRGIAGFRCARVVQEKLERRQNERRMAVRLRDRSRLL